MLSKKLYRSPGIVVFFILSGCGFYLRGSQSLPASFKKISVSCNLPGTNLCHKISKIFLTQGTKIQAGSPLSLRVKNYRTNRRAVALNSNATAAEYEITHSLQFSLTYQLKGRSYTLINNKKIKAQESYQYKNSSVLGSSREEAQIGPILDNRLSRQLIKRLSPFNQAKIHQEIQSYETQSRTKKP